MRIHWVTAAMLSIATAAVAAAGERAGSREGDGGVERLAPSGVSVSRETAAKSRSRAGNRMARPAIVNASPVGSEPRWGGRIQGRWWAGTQAPGGWSAYRRPLSGSVLPSFWVTPDYAISDWSEYGLPRPSAGYNWSRYYDDAVLIDGRGSVYDTIGGVDWDQGDGDGVDYAYQDRGQGAAFGRDRWSSDDDGYAYPSLVPPDASSKAPRRDRGVGGTTVGAVAGGAAGAAIAGRGNRLGGALVGGGVGALTGQAIDRAGDRGHVSPLPAPAPAPAPPPPPPPPLRSPGAGYPPPPHGNPPVVTRSVAPVGTSNGSVTSVVTTAGGAPVGRQGGYYANGYYYPAPTITTITIESKPVYNTTTTTETWVDEPDVRRPSQSKVRQKPRRSAPK